MMKALFLSLLLTWWDMTPYEVREKINQRIMAIDAETPPVMSIENRVIEVDSRSTPIRIYRPNDRTDLPVILFIHGGAWVGGTLDTHDNLARYLCNKTESIVVSVGYLNAPEGKFPLPLEQCYDALQWIVSNLKPSKIIVVGDSAGGNLAAALCLLARDRSGPRIDLQVLINPATDLTDPNEEVRWQAAQYLPHPSDAKKGYASPLLAPNLKGLPPALVILAEHDDLREMGQKYADRLVAADVPTQVYCQKGIGHLAGHGARASLQARESLDVAVTAIKNLNRFR